MEKKAVYKGTPMFKYDFASLYPNMTNPVIDEAWNARLRSMLRNRMIDEVLADLDLPENQHYIHD